ncbi:MAG: 50S ribosomal protein L29 [Planctomycetes bacterium]|nr:50S ribosomal protein L29 [Planctomycetota bacterium]
MKISEVRALSSEELANELDRIRRHLFDLRAQAVTERLEDPTMIAKAKTDIARLLTVQRQRDLAITGEDKQVIEQE